MRNRFGGDCYFCGKWVKPKAGHFEKIAGGGRMSHWRVIHTHCVYEQRKLLAEKEAERKANA